jgi:hypothetical protein
MPDLIGHPEDLFSTPDELNWISAGAGMTSQGEGRNKKNRKPSAFPPSLRASSPPEAIWGDRFNKNVHKGCTGQDCYSHSNRVFVPDLI